MTVFSLNPALDLSALAHRFAADGRVQVAPFLDDGQTASLLEHLRGREDWREVINAGERVYEFDRTGQRSLPPEKREQLDVMVHAAARTGFQFRYESLRVPDDPAERHGERDLLHHFAEFLCAPDTLEALRSITGFADVRFADAQATAYRPGDFLTAHDDDVEGKNRRAAYVFGMTSEWRPEWGGLLMFHDQQGDIERALLPRFNCLNIFAVPQLHSVSAVAPFAGAVRYSVTGWLRTRGDG